LGKSGGTWALYSANRPSARNARSKKGTYARSRPYADIDPTEIFGGGSDRISERESSIWIAQNVERKLRNFLGHKFWARGYFVSTVGRDEETIRTYIKNQEMADKQLDQLQLKLASS
jgi:REP element-mobilizing transposase RayT